MADIGSVLPENPEEDDTSGFGQKVAAAEQFMKSLKDSAVVRDQDFIALLANTPFDLYSSAMFGEEEVEGVEEDTSPAAGASKIDPLTGLPLTDEQYMAMFDEEEEAGGTEE